MAPTQDNIVSITVSHVKGNNPYGHSTIQVGGDKQVGFVLKSDKAAAKAASKQVGEAVRGEVVKPEPAAGHIEASSAKVEASLTLYVTKDQANAMRAYIGSPSHSPDRYDAVFNNCANFSERVLGAGGSKPRRI